MGEKRYYRTLNLDNTKRSTEMAFTPSNNILDKDTHNMLVKSFVNGGIGYTEVDGTVHKISGDYIEDDSPSLPEVSADDNGDVLTVVEGEWAKAAPSGGGSVFAAMEVMSYPYVATDVGNDAYSVAIISISDADFERVANGGIPVLVTLDGDIGFPSWKESSKSLLLSTSETATAIGASYWFADDIAISPCISVYLEEETWFIMSETDAAKIRPIAS